MSKGILTPQMERLISSLLTATVNGTVEWLVTDDPRTFAFAGSSGSVLITKHDDGWGNLLRVLDGTGSLEDSYRGTHGDLNRLIAAAERRAVDILRESPVVDALLRELDTASVR